MKIIFQTPKYKLAGKLLIGEGRQAASDVLNVAKENKRTALVTLQQFTSPLNSEQQNEKIVWRSFGGAMVMLNNLQKTCF